MGLMPAYVAGQSFPSLDTCSFVFQVFGILAYLHLHKWKTNICRILGLDNYITVSVGWESIIYWLKKVRRNFTIRQKTS